MDFMLQISMIKTGYYCLPYKVIKQQFIFNGKLSL